MPIIFSILRVAASILVVAYVSILSFFGLAEPEQNILQETQSAPPQQEREIQQILPPIPAAPQESESPPPLTTSTNNDTLPEETAVPVEPPFAPPNPSPDFLREKAPEPEEIGELPPDPPIQPSFSEINQHTRDALVNILCTTKQSGPFKPITGSGIIIDERGVILTNAHVAQFFLLQDYPVKDSMGCTIRTGSPARSTYRATVLHIAPKWIEENANNITLENPLGTGENDYAFLLITKHIDPKKSLPKTFSFIPPVVKDESINQNNEVLLAGYPAGFLGGITIQKDLYIVSTIGQIKELFTFKETTLDLFSIIGSIISQKGSSGGAVVSKDNKLIGIIVTATDGETTKERELRAITLSHIDRSLRKYANFDLAFLLFGDLKVKAGVFNLTSAIPLTTLLINELEK